MLRQGLSCWEYNGQVKLGQYDNLNCSLGCDKLESQEHLIVCDKNGLNFKNDNLNYEDLFSNDIQKLKIIEKKLSSALAAKNKILEGQT